MTLTRPLSVLIVDDEDSFRMSLEIALKMSNRHLIESCSSGEMAIELLGKKEYDVILLDYKMPNKSGLDVLQWMHSNKIDTPVIMLTGVGSEELAVGAMKLGAYDYISKVHLEIDRLPLTISSVHERHLYRKEIEHRKLEEQKEEERRKELSSLQMFQNTVSSVGEFVNSGLATLAGKIQDRESELMKFVKAEGQEELLKTLADLKHELEVVSSGVKSMLELSTLVTQKLEGIQNSRREEGKDSQK